MLRLMMVTGDNPNTLSNCLARGLEDADCLLSAVNLDAVAQRGRSGRLRRVIGFCAPELAFPEYNRALLEAAERFRPDAVWVFKGMELYPMTCRLLRRRGVRLVNYNADHPFNYFSRGSGNRNVRRSILEFDLHLTYSRRIAAEMRNRFPGICVAVVPFGHDVGDDTYARIAEEEEILRACFLGNPDDHRRCRISEIVKAGIPIDVYGHRWDQFLEPAPTLRIHSSALGEDMLRTLRRYRVQLNFFRPHNAASHNMRSFEVPACGGVMLAEDSVEHRAFFESGREAFFFRDDYEMIATCRAILELPKHEADELRRRARRRTLAAKYSYRDRALAALAEIKRVCEAK